MEDVLQIPLGAAAGDVRGRAREAAKGSLEFFLSRVASVEVPEGAVSALEQSGAKAVLLAPAGMAEELAAAVAFWIQLQGRTVSVSVVGGPKTCDPSEAVRWLFPEVEPVVLRAADRFAHVVVVEAPRGVMVYDLRG